MELGNSALRILSMLLKEKSTAYSLSKTLRKWRRAIQFQCKQLEKKGLIKSEKSEEGRRRRPYSLTLRGLLELIRRETRDPELWMHEVAEVSRELLPEISSSTFFGKYLKDVVLALRFIARELSFSMDRIKDEETLRNSVYYRFAYLILAPKLKKPSFSAGFREAVSADPIAIYWYGAEIGWILLYLTQFLYRAENFVEVGKTIGKSDWFQKLPEEEKAFITTLPRLLKALPLNLTELPRSFGGILKRHLWLLQANRDVDQFL